MRKPVIGITTSISEDERTLQLNQCHTKLLFSLGALPVILPTTTDAAVIRAYVDMVDGVMLTGGNDVDPLAFGEHQSWLSGSISPLRDEFEMTLCRELVRRPEKAVIGICRGFQVMNIALGGDIYQDIREGYAKPAISHRQKQLAKYASHPVSLAGGCVIRRVTGSDTLMVNSLHHQAVRKMAEGFIPVATAPDGIVEAAELAGHPFFVGVQWHPELLWQEGAGDTPHRRLFEAFVEAARH